MRFLEFFYEFLQLTDFFGGTHIVIQQVFEASAVFYESYLIVDQFKFVLELLYPSFFDSHVFLQLLSLVSISLLFGALEINLQH